MEHRIEHITQSMKRNFCFTGWAAAVRVGSVGFQVSGLSRRGKTTLHSSQRVQSTYMVQSMVSVVVISLMVWVSIPHMGT